ncbi:MULTISPECIES: LacI family DNA-binding transcriptional regulator [Tenacibaculum]|uniref:LacI family DNA-binding transcriptional regulator n=1 Tax=Tenacibaculum TaxID=104267 RepID=UPI000898BD05|nr:MULTISPECIES: LacI family DNA-binding transcriptional regulator [unclassified Tenacibaculum]RBW54299.1 LacI family transcriptional regulator [Tenacibaculum sp. E3R01]SED66330.1 transcriptional regulator, LacI family [Tenacibaculum sp. MAR_2010_89]
MNYNVTLKEIALKSGVSVSTVSKALNDSHEISSITKERISKIAKSLNYRPNFFAKNLKRKTNFIIGVILPDLKNDFFSNLLVGITEETCEKKHRIMVYQTCNSPEKEITYTKLLSENIIDGLIISPSLFPERHAEDNKYLIKLSERHLPIIVINKMVDNVVYTNTQLKQSNNGLKLGKDLVSNMISKIKNYNLQLEVS